MPTNTDLVKDLPADFEIFGQAVDTQIKTNADAAINKTIIDAAGDLIYGTAADTAARLALGTAGQVLTVNSGATAPEWQTSNTGGMTLISTTTLSGSSVLLSSIPATYQDLKIVIRNFLPATDNVTMSMRFNDDANASRHQTWSDYVTNSNLSFSNTSVAVVSSQDNGVSQAITVIDLFDYANTTTWKMGTRKSMSNNATTTTNFNSNASNFGYNQTGAVSSLRFRIDGTIVFTSGELLLYGVK